jgi:large subunit ribosomal protein L13
MGNENNRTFLKNREQVDRTWFVLDAAGKTLGRFAAEVSKILIGKHRPDYTPHLDGGDGVIIVNAEKIQVTGAKRRQKIYRYYTGSMSGLREVPFDTMQSRKPAYIIESAVRGMLPKNRLAKLRMKRLRVYAGGQHDMEAQQPIAVTM